MKKFILTAAGAISLALTISVASVTPAEAQRLDRISGCVREHPCGQVIFQDGISYLLDRKLPRDQHMSVVGIKGNWHFFCFAQQFKVVGARRTGKICTQTR